MATFAHLTIQEVKESLPLVAAGLALLYGLGWIMEVAASTTVGIGAIGGGRERPIAAAVFFLLGPVLPVIGVAGRVMAKSARPWVEVVLVVLALSITGTLVTILVSAFLVRTMPDVAFFRSCGIFIIYGLMAGIVLAAIGSLIIVGDASSKDSRMTILLLPSMVLWATVYGSVMLPCLPSAMGGFDVIPVRVTLKPLDEKERPETTAMYLVSTDEKTVVLAARSPLAERRTSLAGIDPGSLHRVPWDRVVSIDGFSIE